MFKIATSGRIYRIAGDGAAGFSGDGGLATQARLGNSYGVAVGPGGEIYIADESNHRIRRLTPDPPQRLEAANGTTYSGIPGTTLGTPISVRVIGTTGLPLPGVTVSFAVTSGDADLVASSAVADAMGVAGVLATLGNSPGPDDTPAEWRGS